MDLIHNIKTIACRLISDLVKVDEWVVLESIRRHDDHHFMECFVVRTKSTLSNEHHPDFKTDKFDQEK